MTLPTDNIRGFDDLCEKYKDDILNVTSGNTGIYYTSASTTVLSTGYNFCDIDLDGDNGDLADVLEMLKHIDPTDQDINPTSSNWDHFIEVLSYYDPESVQGTLSKTSNNGPCMSLRRIRDEFNSGATGSISFSDFYRSGSYVTDNNTGIPTSGTMDLADFYGAAKEFSIEVLMVAGGGGAGSSNSGRPAGSGGAGGVLFGTLSMAPGTYSVTVGGGGAGGANGNDAGDAGGDSTITVNGTTYTAFGGGGGGSSIDGGGAGGGTAANGGSGGGGALSQNASRSGGIATQTSPQGTLTGYGNNGGTAGTSTAIADYAGGGGAGSIGYKANGGGAGPGIALTVGSTQYTVAIGGGATNNNVFWINGSNSNTTTGSGTIYGRGGSTSSGSGLAGAIILRGPSGSNLVKTASGNITVNSDGSIS